MYGFMSILCGPDFTFIVKKKVITKKFATSVDNILKDKCFLKVYVDFIVNVLDSKIRFERKY